MAKPIEAPPAINMETSAITLVRREMQRLASQLRIIGPNKSLFSNLLCHWGDERAKNQAASRMKGVLGKIGSGIPSKPSSRKRKPSGLYNLFCK